MKRKIIGSSSFVFILIIILVIFFSISLQPAKAAYSFTGNGSDVMLQGFIWESYKYGWWNVISQNSGVISNGGFSMVWLPPCSSAGSNEGYLPIEWYNLNSKYGTQSELQKAINSLHSNGIRAIADIVINHRNGLKNWADFTNPAFENNYTAICSDDEFFYMGNPGANITTRGNLDTGEGYTAARDLDHTNKSVQTEVINWQKWLKNNIGFDGWRYDYVKGFNGYYVNLYNSYTSPYFSVGEYWPTNYFDINYPDGWRQEIINWIDATQGSSTAFDFVTKPVLAYALSNNDFSKLVDSNGKPSGLIGIWPDHAVTFLDNHDTASSGGQGHWPFPSNYVEQGYAYILTHPGTPCVFWPHYFDWGTSLQNSIKKMVSIRKSQGITSSSSIKILAADSSKYAAIVNNNTAVKIGPGDWAPGSGWYLAASGYNYAIWTR